MLVSQSDTFILTCHIRVVQSLELWLCIATSHLSGTTSFLAGGALATYQILFQFIVFLGDQLCKVIFSLFSYLANAEILLAGRPHIRQSVIHYHLPLLCINLTNFGLQVQKVVLLRLDKCRCLLGLLLKLLLSVDQVSLQLVKTGIMNVAHLHLRERSQLSQLLSTITCSTIFLRENRIICLIWPIRLLLRMDDLDL